MDTSSDSRVRDSLRNIVDLLENISDGLFALDPEWRFIYWNTPAEKILKRVGVNLDGRSFWEEFPEFANSEFRSQFERVLREGAASHFEAFIPAYGAWFSASVHLADEGIAVYLRDITDYRRLQAEVSVTDLRFRTMIDRLPDSAVLREGEHLLLNPAAQRLLGYSQDEIGTIDSWFEILHPSDVEESRQRYELLRAEGFPRLRTTALRTRDGAILQIQMIAYIDDRCEFWILQDLTERLLTEQKFRVLFEHSKMAYFLFSPDGIIDCNDAAVKQMRLSSKEPLMGRSFISLSPEMQADGQSSFDKLEQVNQDLAQQGQMSFEWTHLRADGTKAEVFVSVSRFIVNDETLELVVWKDLSEIRLAEDKLRQSEDRFKTIIDNTDEIIYTLSLDGTFTFVSHSWTRHLGHEVCEVIGKQFVDFVHAEDVIKGKVYTYRLVKDPGFRGSVMYRALHADGSYRWHETTGSVVFDADGNPQHFVGLSRDVTERRLARAALEEARDQALASSRAKSQFLATVSHEIRTPLNGVLGMTNLLADTSLNSEQTNYLRTIQASGEILRRVIDDVLDFSSIEAGKLSIDAHAVDVIAAIHDVVSLFEGRAHEKGIGLTMDMGDLKALHVYADHARVKQVVANLIGNAVKFTERGRVRVVLTLVRETRTAMVLRIEVIDSGIGIVPSRVEAVFEGFTQADNSMHRRYGGSGLGLTIAKRLTDLMGGEIGVDSEVGVGSRFWVELPLAKIPEAKPKPTKVEQEASLIDVRVLLAEDNEINIEVAQRQIELLGCHVEVAQNGVQAVDLFLSQPFHLILMDVQMPDMDGLEATRQIRMREEKIGGHIPIIALTATAFDEDKKACNDAGMDDFLSKPFKREDLQRVLIDWSAARRAEPDLKV